MKTTPIIILCSILSLISCNNKNIKTNIIENVKKEESLKNANRIGSESKTKTVIENLTNEQLYITGEARRDSSLKLISKPETLSRTFREIINEDTTITVLYYQPNKIIAINKRVIDKNNNKLLNQIFFFNNNECISANYWNNREKITYTYDMYWNALIKYDVGYHRIQMDEIEKTHIIQSTDSLINSIMKHFPEFKYSFKWN